MEIAKLFSKNLGLGLLAQRTCDDCGFVLLTAVILRFPLWSGGNDNVPNLHFPPVNPDHEKFNRYPVAPTYRTEDSTSGVSQIDFAANERTFYALAASDFVEPQVDSVHQQIK